MYRLGPIVTNISFVLFQCVAVMLPGFARPSNKIAVDQVTTVRAEGHSLTRQIPVYGCIDSTRYESLRFANKGVVSKVFVIDDQTVAKGDLLAKLDLTMLQPNLDTLNIRVAQLDKKIQAATAEEKKQAVQLLQNEHALSLAKQHYEKQKRLYAERIITQNQLDESAFRLDERKSIHLQSNYLIAKTHDKIALLRQHRRNAQQTIKDIQRQISQSELRAPFSGKVERIHAKPGQSVSSNDVVLTLFDPAQMRLRAVVSHAEIRELKQYLKKNSRVPVKLVWQDQSVEGHVINILPYSKSETLGVDVLVDLDSQVSKRLLSPQRFMMIVPTDRRLFTLPVDAIQDGSFVVKVSDSGKIQRAAVTKIRPAAVNPHHVVLESEQLQSSDEIVVASKVAVHEGDVLIKNSGV